MKKKFAARIPEHAIDSDVGEEGDGLAGASSGGAGFRGSGAARVRVDPGWRSPDWKSTEEQASRENERQIRAEISANEGATRRLASGIALLFPRIAVGVVAVAFPEAEALFTKQHKAAHPLHAFPCVKMRDDQAQRASVFPSKRHAIVFQGE